MEKQTPITHQQFVKGYKSGEFTVHVNKNRAGDFVLSGFADKHNKPAHIFWTWLGILLIVPAPIILFILYGWVYALGSVVIGLTIYSATRKSASQFMLQNMLENEDFWEYVLLHKGAIILDREGSEIKSEFLERMSEKYGKPE